MNRSWKTAPVAATRARWPWLLVASVLALAIVWLATGWAILLVVGLAGGSLGLVACQIQRRRNERAGDGGDAQCGQELRSPTKPGEQSLFAVLPAYARADEVASVLFSQQYFFPVEEGGKVVGVLSKNRLLVALANGQGDRLIAELMNKGWDDADAACVRTDVRSMGQWS